MDIVSARSGHIPQINAHGILLEVDIGGVKKVEDHHWIKIIDCSGSMSSVIGNVRNDCKKFVAELVERDFVSLIIFSGHNRAKLIAGPTRCDKKGRETLHKAIDESVQIMDTTVFSEPLELALKTVQKITDGCANMGILLTDGCAVPNKWSVKEEENKAAKAAKAIADTGAGLSVIGYGNWYNATFLARLMRESGGNGLYRHISEIEDFTGAVNGIRETFEKTVRGSIDVTLKPSAGSISRFIRVTPQVSETVGTQFQSTAFYEGKAMLFIETSKDAKSVMVEGRVNGKAFKESATLKPMNDNDKLAFIRAYAAQAVLSGNRSTAAEYLEMIGEDGLAEQVGNAFTDREAREVEDRFRGIFTSGKRFIGTGLKPVGPNHSVLNVVRQLIEDPQSVIYIPKGAYKRAGELVVDPRVLEGTGDRSLQVLDIISHNERFNFSFRALKDIKVLPEDGKGRPEDMKQFRTYNIVRDGNLVMNELEASVSEETFKLLLEAGVLKAGTEFKLGKTYTLDLRSLKMISPTWAKPGQMKLAPMLCLESDLEEKQSALNSRLKELKAQGQSKECEESDIYYGKAQKDEERETDTYTATTVEYRLMGHKPKSFDASKLDWDAANTTVKETRRELSNLRYKIRAVTFAMERCNQTAIKWPAGKPNKKGTIEHLVDFDGVKIKRAVREQTFVCS